MKNLANYVSISRILLSLSLLFTSPLSLEFCIIYVICALSDILDGYLAKKYGSTKIGPKLDSIADAIFFLSMLIVLYPILNIGYFVLISILAIILIKILSITIGFIKFKQFALIHTYLNKSIGFLIILLPLWLLIIKSTGIILNVVNILCVIAIIAAIEELAIIIFSKTLDLDLKTVFLL
ncbi:MAG: CDP-alcohol phosphatidyltransferase family protein [Methanobacteriaceae archaeon]|nr:CDP-alcohol phosphatidyltransferase family protein [Methanobacteriaceae archaeon]